MYGSVMRRSALKVLHGFSETQPVVPKWTRFFGKFEPLSVNIDRSLRNEFSELLNQYVKTNYKTFSMQQMQKALEKQMTQETNKLVMYEIMERILVKQATLDLETLELILSQIEKKHWMVSIYQQHVLVEGFDKFKELSINGKTSYLQHAYMQKYWNPQLMNEFIKVLPMDDEYFDQLSLQQYRFLFETLDMYKNPTQIDGLADGFINKLMDKYLLIWRNDKLLLQKGQNTDLSLYMLQKWPSYFPKQYKEDLKKVYAQILEKMVDRDYQYFINRPQYVRVLLHQALFWLYDTTDFPLISRVVSLLFDHTKIEAKNEYQAHLLLEKYQYFHPTLCHSMFQQIKQLQHRNISLDDINHVHFSKALVFLRLQLQEGLKQHQVSQEEIQKCKSLQSVIFSKYFELVNSNDLISKITDFLSHQIYQSVVYDIDSRNDFEAIISSQPQQVEDNDEETGNNGDKLRQLVSKYTDLLKLQHEILKKNGFLFTEYRVSDQRIKPLQYFYSYIEVTATALQYDINLAPQISTKLFKDPLFKQILQKVPYIPYLLDNIIIIYKLAPQLFPTDETNAALAIKQELDKLINESTSPQDYITKIESELATYDLTEFRQEFYRIHRRSNLMMFNFAKPIDIQLDSQFKSPMIEHTMDQTYCYNRRNTLLKSMFTSDTILDHTPFKQLIWESLQLDNQQWLMNYSDFPFILDFVCHAQKIVVFLDEYPRLFRGVEKVRNQSTVLASQLYRTLGYDVYYIDPSTYHPNPEEQLNILKMKFVYRFQNQ